MKNTINYSQFLFHNLLCLNNGEYLNMEYDRQWDMLPRLYQDFAISKYNVGQSSEYDCIIQYLKTEKINLKK